MTTDNRDHSPNAWFTLGIVAAACAVLAVALLAMQPQAVYALPPRPTVELTPVAGGSSTGAQIQLQVRFPASWPWQTTRWQDLWTIVQWQDPQGKWHVVDGWQGTLDEVETGKDGTVGYKTWWLGKENLGQGPFRWQVYQGKGGRLLATSEPFDLPDISKTVLAVVVTLP